MTEIQDFVRSYLKQSMAGQEMENSKFDFKRQWYDLTDERGISEFLKDTTAMANSFGPAAYIVIGFDDKRKEFINSTFKDCKLRDTADVSNLINSRVDRLFNFDIHEITIDDHLLSVIRIPPSIDKPHVIRNHITRNGQESKNEENRIFVRRGTSTRIAAKSDLELMYYDRKNIIPEYELYAGYHLHSSLLTITGDSTLLFNCDLALENSGKRSLAIRKIKFDLNVQGEQHVLESPTSMEYQNLIITPGEIVSRKFDFYTSQPLIFNNENERKIKDSWFRQERDNINCAPLNIFLANGKKIMSDLEVIKSLYN